MFKVGDVVKYVGEPFGGGYNVHILKAGDTGVVVDVLLSKAGRSPRVRIFLDPDPKPWTALEPNWVMLLEAQHV